MKSDKNNTDIEINIPQQHKEIADELKLGGRFEEFIKKQKQDYDLDGKRKQKFSDYSKEKLINHFKLVCKSCGESLGKLWLDKKIQHKSDASRLTKRLNFFLKDYCRDIDIDPEHPIQAFSCYEEEPNKIVEIGFHLTCAKSRISQKKQPYSWDNITLDEAIERGKLQDNKEIRTQTHTSPFIKLEKRLEPFYKRYPTKKDFEEGGSYCRIDELHEEITNKLREKKCCLIIGNPGCGKTTLALALGYDFLQDNYSVYYHDASTSSDIKQLIDFIESCGKNDLA